MGMSPRLLRPRQTIHPEAADWANRVRSNGASVSGSTLSAVDKFCKTISQNNLRDRFYRLNLFCGTGINACLVPLYRGQSLAGTQYGNTTDTNNGPFVSGDYVETGASGGLTGNGITKWLNTGVQQSTLGTTGHYSVFARHAADYADGTVYRMIGLIDLSSGQYYIIDTRAVIASYGAGKTGFVGAYGSTNFFANNAATLSGGQLMTIVRQSSASAQSYLNGTLFTNNTSSTSASNVSADIYVYAENRVGSGASNHSAMTFGAYSIGLPMTSTQVTSYYAAMSAFQTALNRNSGL